MQNEREFEKRNGKNKKKANGFKKLNNWVMHPVARVSIKYWKNLRTQQSIF
jgi:hypothetical protein